MELAEDLDGSVFRFLVYIHGIRRPTQTSFSLKNSSAFVECRHCLAYRGLEIRGEGFGFRVWGLVVWI